MLEQVVLTAHTVLEDGSFVARLDRLSLAGTGGSAEEAEEDLIRLMRAWIETHDSLDDLGEILSQAGFPGVDEDTELQLEFVGELVE